jgi:ribosomal protein S10
MNSIIIRRSRLWSPCFSIVIRHKGVYAGPGQPISAADRPKALYLKQYHEPKYLELLKPQIPFYDVVNVKVRGYDYAVLEEYIRFIQRTAKTLNIKLQDFWALPAVSIKQESLHHASEMVSGSETIKIHERTVQVKHMTSKICSIFIEAIQAAKPTLVTLHLSEHSNDAEEARYIPDLMLKSMEEELTELKETPVSVLSPAVKKKVK